MTIASQNIHFLNQSRELIARLAESQFTAVGSLGGKASTGAHLRHCIDYYRCFLRGLAAGKIDYDARQREPELETRPAAALRALEEIAEQLANIEVEDVSRPLQVKVDAAAWQQPNSSWSRSSIGRELQFLMSHTVHHYALIAMVLRSQGLEPGADFGVAPSTLEHRETSAACAS